MYYNTPNYSDYASGSNFQEFVPGSAEYERKRKEQELLASQGQPSIAGPVNPSLMDRFSNNVQQGLENLQQAPQNFVNNVQQLPEQFQQGVQNVQNMIKPVSPEQQTQVAGPTVMPPAQTEVALPIEQTQPTQASVRLIDNQIEKYHSLQDDPKGLMDLGYDKTAPEWMQERARNRAVELLTQQREERKAKEQMSNLSETDLTRALAKKTSDGSWIKYLLLKHVGLTDLADAEAAKLKIGKETYGTLNNEPVSLTMAPNGTVISGFNAVTGKQLTPKELITAAQNATVQKGTTTHTGKMQDITTKEVYYEQTTPNGIRLVDNNGKVYTGPSSNLRPFGIGSDIATKNEIQLQELRNKLAYIPANKRAEVLAEHEANYGKLPDAVRNQILSAQPMAEVSGTAPTGTTGAPASTTPAAVAPAAPATTTTPTTNKTPASNVTATSLPGGGVKVTPGTASVGGVGGASPADIKINKDIAKQQKLSDIEVNAAGKKERATVAGKTIDEKLNMLNDIQYGVQNGINAIETNAHLLGGGTNAAQRMYYRNNPLATQTTEYANTAAILKLAQQDNLTNLASLLKGSFSDKDLAYVNKNMINENSSPADVKKWLEHYERAARRAYEQQANSVNNPTANQPGAPAAPTSQFIEGKVYVDAKGNKAKYVNGKWEPQ